MLLLNIYFPFMRNTLVGILLAIETSSTEGMDSGQSFWSKQEKNNKGDFTGLFWESSPVL